MVSVEREVVVFPAVAGVGQNVAAAFGEAQKYVSETKHRCHRCVEGSAFTAGRRPEGGWGDCSRTTDAPAQTLTRPSETPR